MKRSSNLARIVPLATAMLIRATPVDAQTTEPSPGVSRELAEERAQLVSDLRYDLSVSIPAARAEPVTGVNVIRFRLSGPRSALVLDFDPASAPSLKIEANGHTTHVSPIRGHLVIPASFLHSGENSLRISFQAGDAPLNRNTDFLYTLFVPARAHEAFPCFDQPDLKGRWTITLEHPANWKSSSNGAPLEQRTTGDRTQVRFAPTPPLPTYLVAFVAGDFKVETAQRGPWTMNMFHRETDTARLAGNRDAIFDLHARALQDLQRYTGIAYPFGKFDFVLIPAFQYGGMEHAANILYDAENLLLDESATQDDQLRRARIIAHETSHMWFGDLVTMRWFDDVWTKEVFAEFMAAKVVNPTFPNLNHKLRFLLSNHRNAYRVDRTAGANPIRQALGNLDEAAQLYGPIIYYKSQIVMRQIEATMGESAFRDGVREYLRTYAFGNATWDDLIRILGKHTRRDLKEMSRVWIDTAGRPTISAELVVQDGRVQRLTLRQSDPQHLGRTWPQQLRVAVDCGVERKLLPVDMGAEAVDLSELVRDCNPRYVLAGGDGWGYGDFELDHASLDYLAASLDQIDDPLTRGSAWLALVDAMFDGRVAPARLFGTLMQALEHESDEQQADAMLSDLPTLWWRFFTASMRQQHAPELEAALRRGLERAQTATLKAAWFRQLRSVGLTPGTASWLRAVWSKEQTIPGLTLGESDETELAQELALHEVDGWRAILQEQLERIQNPDRRSRFQFVLPALSSNVQERASWFLALQQPEARRHEAWVAEGLHYLHHPLRAEASAPLVRPGLDMLVEIQKTGDIFFPTRWLGGILNGHSSPQVATTVQSFLDDRPADYPARLRQLVLQNADTLFRAARSRSGLWPQSATASAEASRRPERQVAGNVLTSMKEPNVQVELPSTAHYVGADRWVLYGMADCELHALVEADEQKNVQRLYWIQFEGYLPTRPELHHTYDSARHAPIGGLDFYVDTWVEAGAANDEAGSDSEHIKALVRAGGYRLPAALMSVRFVHLLDQEKRKELMIIYSEDAATTGFAASDLRPGGKAHNQWPEIADGLVQRGLNRILLRPGPPP
jgi:aminopeptidase N